MVKIYKMSDVSVVIPTYNRTEELRVTLDSINKFKELGEIIVVDQSNDDKTLKLCQKYKKVKYIYSEIPSITIARNLGVKSSSEKSKIISFIDDDVSLGDNYYDEILKVFNKYKKSVAVGGFFYPGKRTKIDLIKSIFLLNHLEKKERARIISGYGNTYPEKLTRIINSQWLPGVNMNYKKDIFKELQFDEKLLGYTIAEDISFSYSLYSKYPLGIFITPFAKIIHRASKTSRTHTIKMAYINQVDHFYFFFKKMGGSLNKIKFIWSLFGIIILRSFCLLSFKRENYMKWKYFIKSLIYCIKNKERIKKGQVRLFENEIPHL